MVWGKGGREVRGVDSRPQLERRWSEAAWPRRAAGGGGPRPASWRRGGGQGGGEKQEGTKGVLSPTLARTGAQRGGGSAMAGVLEAAAMVVAAVLGSWRG